MESKSMGALFVGAILLLVGFYVILTGESDSAKIFGGGVPIILAIIVFIMPVLLKPKKA